MTILTLSGSPHPRSRNSELLRALSTYLPDEYSLLTSVRLDHLPLFQPQLDRAPWPDVVLELRRQVATAAAVVISTPEYLRTLPAVLKNALEWLTSSGELSQKRVLPISFTPHPPRGEGAMQALLASLQALDCRVVAALPLYQEEQRWTDQGLVLGEDTQEILPEALALLWN
ncbi:MAG: NAD(P)H-dependent oxidoreductase [Bacteroidetes bacterium]|nr:MAG: NAD(P)H-dependent oxidoreductase [Bacteroidota bacterium]